MWIVFLIWTGCAVLFLTIGIVTWHSKKTVGFFTGVKPPKVTDSISYNHAVAKIWVVFSLLFELMALPFLWIGEESAYGIVSALLVMVWALGLIITYLIVEQKYKI